jgi:hypothetical protein
MRSNYKFNFYFSLLPAGQKLLRFRGCFQHCVRHRERPQGAFREPLANTQEGRTINLPTVPTAGL